MMDDSTHSEVGDDPLKQVRKFRKKLRQIERLERSGRDLTTDEKLKIATKGSLRGHLQTLLNSINRKEDSFNSTLGNDIHESSEDDETMPAFAESRNEQISATSLKDIEKTVTPSDEPLREESGEIISIPSKKIKVVDPVVETTEPEKSLTSKTQKLPKVKDKQPKLRSKLRKLWRNRTYSVISLHGHNDVICDVSAYGGWIVSGSRDTSVKLWDISSKSEIRNMSGHTGAVTAVQMLDDEESNRLRALISAESDSELMHDMSIKEFLQELLLVTASTDCYVKLWLLPQGFCVKSIYNYSPISSLCHKRNYVFLGSDSGKLTVYNLVNRQQLYDVIIHSDSITSLQCDGNVLSSTSNDGNLKVWEICDENEKSISLEKTTSQLYLKSKFNLLESDFYVESRQILCSCLSSSQLFYGDDGINVKVFNISEGNVTKHCNHKSPGFTDACFLMNDLLLTTSFDLDLGTGSVNMRCNSAELPLAYIASLSCDELPRLTCAAHDPTSDSGIFCTGGTSLLLWKPHHGHKSASDTTLERDGIVHVKGTNIAELGKTAVHSDVESDTSDGEADSGSWWWSKKLPETGSNRIRGSQEESDSDSDDSEAASDKSKYENRWSDWCALL